MIRLLTISWLRLPGWQRFTFSLFQLHGRCGRSFYNLSIEASRKDLPILNMRGIK
jgi:hypothetical protein